MDALAAGCPVVLVRVPGGRSGADLELRDAGLPVVDSPDELAAAIDSVADQEHRSAYFVERAASVRRLIGPPDAVERVVHLALHGSSDQAEAAPRSAT
jgi:glycosyltransferase involved in cell wall biosynthesis